LYMQLSWLACIMKHMSMHLKPGQKCNIFISYVSVPSGFMFSLQAP
jgi:hypothetical protein